MGFRIKDAADPGVAAFLARVDRSRAADRDGDVDAAEAAHAARRIRSDAAFRRDAVDAFGAAPASGAELLRFAARPPREEALERILTTSVLAGRAEMIASGRGEELALGDDVVLTAGGRLRVGARLPSSLREAARALTAAAEHGAVLGQATLGDAVGPRLLKHLSDSLEVGLAGRGGRDRQKLFCGAMTLLLSLARSAARGRKAELASACVDRFLQALSGQRDQEIAVFYMGALEGRVDEGLDLDPAQRAALAHLHAQLVPSAPPVDAWTDGGKKTLVVRHMIHPEFWGEELGYYTKKNGWKLLSRDAKTGARVYERTDAGVDGRPPQKTRVTITRGELDFLEGMGDEKTHAIVYSGHSALGANGSQSVFDAPESTPGVSKLALLMCCRGKDNYAEFMNRFPDASLITTDTFTYSDPEHSRIRSFYDTLIGRRSYRDMRKGFQRVDLWDEPKDNYVFPDESRRIFWSDADADGRMDRAAHAGDALFDVDARRAGGDFVRAVAFVNSELFYHWEIEHERGTRFTYGPAFGDRVVAGGALEDARPGEVVRVEAKTPRGRDEPRYWEVRYAPRAADEDRDLYAGRVTAHTVAALAEEHFGEARGTEALRAVLMGGQAIHYLCVYDDVAPEVMKRYLEDMGLGALPYEEMDELFELYDAHANDEQLAAFVDLVERRCGVDPLGYVIPA
jgi:hypothetical protein